MIILNDRLGWRRATPACRHDGLSRRAACALR
jgi:hypothetical protein